MDIRIRHDKQGRLLSDLSAGETYSITGGHSTVVRCLKRQLWGTQEDDAQDYAVPAHARFCSAGTGRIVLSAVAAAR